MAKNDGYSVVPKVKEYTYSKPIEVRKWGTGKITVKVGYVKKHPEKHDILLEKEWIGEGGRTQTRSFSIRDEKDWKKIRSSVEELWPELKDQTDGKGISEVIHKVDSAMKFWEIIKQNPRSFREIPEKIDILSLPAQQKETASMLITVGGRISESLIKKLGEEPIKDLEEFLTILEELKLSTINSLVTHITSRLAFIDMFEKVIHNDNSYERRGKNSVHNLLKENIWMVNRNYTILHDDETLKKIIFTQWNKQNIKTKGNKKRPDFLCMVSPIKKEGKYGKLVIIEIKRPRKKIKLSDIDQIMDYQMILQTHSGKRIEDFSCYLVGREIDEKLKMNNFSKSGFVVKSYTDFISEAREFYREYLKIVKSADFAF